MTSAPTGLFAGGRAVPASLTGTLDDNTALRDDGERLNEQLNSQGYLYFRNVLELEPIQSVRQYILSRLHDVGEVCAPAEHAIASGDSRRQEVAPDPGAFLQEMAELPLLRRTTHQGPLAELAGRIIGQQARPFDFLWLRFSPAGRASPLHFDHVYMNRGSPRVVTAWVPLGPVPASDGPLMVVEGSHRFVDLHEQYRGLDVDRQQGRTGAMDCDPVTLAKARKTRLLTSDFEPGDVVIFGMFTLHGSFDNVSPAGRVRLSCDVRYQPAADKTDLRWFGDPPPGHGGLGYAGLSAAQPLNAPPVRR